MKACFLDFEQPIAELEERIENLRLSQEASPANISGNIARFEKKRQQLLQKIYAKLTSWQIVQIARHPQRPGTLDYIRRLFTDFEELHGDRMSADDRAIVGGLARFDGLPVMVIGHQRQGGDEAGSKQGGVIPLPAGYRKALRLMHLAEKFAIPLLTFIDTPGVCLQTDAKVTGQSEAIGCSIHGMTKLKIPIIATVIGEGGAEGALAIGVGDVVQMLQYSTYSVISPEGAAATLWENTEKAAEAADMLAITASRLKALGLIDEVIDEPPGGAHRDPERTAECLGEALRIALKRLSALSSAELVGARFERLMAYGRFKEQPLP